MKNLLEAFLVMILMLSPLALVACGKKEEAYGGSEAQRNAMWQSNYDSCMNKIKEVAGPNNMGTNWAEVMKMCENQAYGRLNL